MKVTAAVSLAVAVSAAALVAPPPAAPQRGPDRELAWGSFARREEDSERRRLPDGDVIAVSVSHAPDLPPAKRLVAWAGRAAGAGGDDDIPRDRLEVVLVSGPGVSRWKGITAFGNAPPEGGAGREENWVRLAHVGTEGGDRGPKRMLLAAADLRGGLKLSFEKAQPSGARVPAYTFNVPNAVRAGGHRITFVWEKDD